ncbi:DUF808 domain-containing protein [Brachybacterium sp. NBEC-018]|uniref:DUF808 domain-containing protein n=1 Tax=Brachybacterium sp. NBEC-018 TaxID=2996004 RepID=UPI0021754B2D|nr:DUF808 domain-containing protein [Brachybacterium sp. NBEC-018]UVY85618.1 DUF808 domain-containing protein [Brachybacterium sp. NBEC-018]
MAGGLAALLDDVAAIAKMAAASTDDVAAASAKASAKAAGVVIDDAAVTPQYVKGLNPSRELPIIWRIARGSFINKLVIILPIALLLSWLAPWALTPILMIGGTYLCFEGAEKVWELVSGAEHEEQPAAAKGADSEKGIVSGAVRTDLILSAEIMVISMNSIDADSIWMRAIILATVGILMTVAVYGAVGLLVKMDDVGLALSRRERKGSQKLGEALVRAMPVVMTVISYVGMVAMLWVGGHIILEGLHTFSLAQPYGLVHHLEEAVARVPAVGAALAWLVNTFFSFVLGLVWGAIIVAVLHVLPFGKKEHGGSGEHGTAETDADAAAVSAPRTEH